MLVQFEEDIVGKVVIYDQVHYRVYFLHIDPELNIPMAYLRPVRGGKTVRTSLLDLEFPHIESSSSS